jgi:uncharacterized RDD family membrane protein YckC
MSETRDRGQLETQRAVCYDRQDYAGPGRRVLIVCIDFVATAVLSFAALVAVTYIHYALYPRREFPVALIWVVPVVAYLYLTVVKRSRVRTLGYILTGVQIVDIEGKRPSLLQMTIRLLPVIPLPAIPVPWPLLFDFGWMIDEPARQTLRDKWAGTFVVRRKAQPVGTASVRYKRIGFAGLFLIFPEAGRPEAVCPPSSTAGPPPLLQ